jgi:hypothetical protein
VLEHNLLAGILKGSEKIGEEKKNYPKITHPAYIAKRKEMRKKITSSLLLLLHSARFFLSIRTTQRIRFQQVHFLFNLLHHPFIFFLIFKNRREF